MQSPENHESAKIKSEQFVKKLEERAPYVKKPFAEWSVEERADFPCHFNNFIHKTPGGEKAEYSKDREDFDLPIKEVDKWSEKQIADSVARGIHSEKYFNTTVRQYYEDIKYYLVNSGIDVKDFSKRNRERMGCNDKMLGLKRGSQEYKEMSKLEVNLRAQLMLEALPAFLDLLDSGYTEIDLSR